MFRCRDFPCQGFPFQILGWLGTFFRNEIPCANVPVLGFNF